MSKTCTHTCFAQEAVETRCLAAMQALAEKDGKIALETLLQTNKYQMQVAAGETKEGET